MREPVKGASDAGRRREVRARETRSRIVDAARRSFERDGYAATTVTAIAAAAGVAPATVYQAFGTKYAILARALDTAIVDDDEPPGVLDRPWVEQVRRHPDARDRLVVVVTRAAEIAARTAPLKTAMRDAAADPDLRGLIQQDDDRRLVTQTALVEVILGVAPGTGMALDQAVATFFGLVNSDCYLLMTRTLGWGLVDWRCWLIDVLSRELLGDGDGDGDGDGSDRRPGNTAAVTGPSGR